MNAFDFEAEWDRLWGQGSVEVEGDPTTAKLTYFTQYSLLSNLPALRPNQPPSDDQFFYGVARSGLAHGSRGQNHQVPIMCFTVPNLIVPLLNTCMGVTPSILTI